jgi:hypothetical protein
MSVQNKGSGGAHCYESASPLRFLVLSGSLYRDWLKGGGDFFLRSTSLIGDASSFRYDLTSRDPAASFFCQRACPRTESREAGIGQRQR